MTKAPTVNPNSTLKIFKYAKNLERNEEKAYKSKLRFRVTDPSLLFTGASLLTVRSINYIYYNNHT